MERVNFQTHKNTPAHSLCPVYLRPKYARVFKDRRKKKMFKTTCSKNLPEEAIQIHGIVIFLEVLECDEEGYT